MIHVFVGSNDKWAECEPVLKYSVEKHASEPVRVIFMRPHDIGMEETGCTTFTNTRYAVPELGRAIGADYGVYIDIDMLLLADIAELYAYRRPGRWVILEDGSDEVAVIDCSLQMPPIHALHRFKKWDLRAQCLQKRAIPLDWNVKDEVADNMKLLHFTDLSRQPWFTPERDDAAVRVLHGVQAEYAATLN